MKLLIPALYAAALLLTTPALAETPWEATSLGLGAQVSWFDRGAAAFNRDTEATANAAMSLTPHFSLVGGAAWGFDHQHLRTAAGARVTATDAEDRDFAVGIGVQRQWVTEDEAGADEWVGDASLGWRPFERWRAILALQAAYGMESKGLRTSAGLRFPFKIVGGGS